MNKIKTLAAALALVVLAGMAACHDAPTGSESPNGNVAPSMDGGVVGGGGGKSDTTKVGQNAGSPPADSTASNGGYLIGGGVAP
jgi:hypothetical protein